MVDFGARDGHSGAEAGIDSDDTAAKEGAILYRDFIRPVKFQHISGAAAQTVNMSRGKALQGDAGAALETEYIGVPGGGFDLHPGRILCHNGQIVHIPDFQGIAVEFLGPTVIVSAQLAVV